MMQRSYWVHALSAIHLGSGTGVDVIDLPVLRDVVKNWPILPGSSLKGVMSANFGADDEKARCDESKLSAAFGLGGNDHASAGALVFSDARLVCFPVQSLYGTFAWITCPLALRLLDRDLGRIGGKTIGAIPEPEKTKGLCPQLPEGQKSALVCGDPATVFLGELDVPVTPDAAVTPFAKYMAQQVFSESADAESWTMLFEERFLVVDDEIFTFFTETSCEVNARIRIHPDTGVVATGALWYEESVPAEAIFMGTVWCDWIAKKHRDKQVTADLLFTEFCTNPLTLQIGGKASTGKGMARVSFCAATPEAQRQGGEAGEEGK